jgi:integrase
MGKTKTAGLFKRGEMWHVDKCITGYGRIRGSTGTSEIEEAERWLIRKLEEIRQATIYGVRPHRSWREAATKYLLENTHKASLESDAYHLKDLDPFIGSLPIHLIHDGALQPFVLARKAAGKKDKTVNLALEVVRRILNLAATRWRDEHGLTWLATAPAITMRVVEDARPPYPLSWAEQRLLLQKLPVHLARMALFNVNTGTREQEVCKLRWDWEVNVPELNTSVFIIPARAVKNREERLVVLNQVAKSIVDDCRGNHPINVFTWKKGPKGKNRPTQSMNNTAWQTGREEAVTAYAETIGEPAPKGFKTLHLHDLKHTFGRRLRAAGVPLETRKVLLGHRNGDITTHYSEAELKELVEAVERVCNINPHNSPTLTILKRKAG